MAKLPEYFHFRVLGSGPKVEIRDVSDHDFVEVVRCRDCRFRSNKWTGCPKLNGTITDDEFFCKCGIKREKS